MQVQSYRIKILFTRPAEERALTKSKKDLRQKKTTAEVTYSMTAIGTFQFCATKGVGLRQEVMRNETGEAGRNLCWTDILHYGIWTFSCRHGLKQENGMIVYLNSYSEKIFRISIRISKLMLTILFCLEF